MNALWLIAFSAVLAASPPRTSPLSPSSVPGIPKWVPKVKVPSHANDTACAKCHVTASWTAVKFNHDLTGFPLKGAHQPMRCKACHGQDVKTPLPSGCAGCHRDEHQGQLGLRCEGCHDELSWKTTFNADAHQRTNFPLLGAHAALPCQECHGEARDRSFSRPALPCSSCHQTALARTLGTAVDHVQLGFTDDCRQCHGGYAFRPARFPGHDRCFFITGGPHANVTCAGCHTTLSTSAAAGTCSTRTAACTQCHQHQCTGPQGATETDRQHANVAGYQCGDRRCYECHPSQVGGP